MLIYAESSQEILGDISFHPFPAAMPAVIVFQSTAKSKSDKCVDFRKYPKINEVILHCLFFKNHFHEKSGNKHYFLKLLSVLHNSISPSVWVIVMGFAGSQSTMVFLSLRMSLLL